MNGIVKYTCSKLNNLKPIHLLGIGDPSDIWGLVKNGIDTFDCVSPTRLARHGSALVKTKIGKINIKNSDQKNNLSSIDKNCKCSTCLNYSISYIHHLFKSDELLGLQLLTTHNVFFMNNLMSYIRKAINDDILFEAEKNWYLD